MFEAETGRITVSGGWVGVLLGWPFREIAMLLEDALSGGTRDRD
jgi:hypothetical protein